MVDDGGVVAADQQIESLARRFEKEGLDTRFLEEPFLEAAELGDASSLQLRLAHLAPEERRRFVKSVDQHGRTGLLLAARRGDADLARVLLEASANPNEADSGGTTAMHYAASCGSTQLIELLLQCRAEVEKRDDQGETPLMWGTGPRVVSLLLEARSDMQSRSNTGRTALMLASAKGDLETMALLAQVPGAELDVKDSQGVSAHALALAAGHRAGGHLLVSLGATPLAVSTTSRVARREDALHEAAKRGDAEGCAALLAEGVAADAEVGGERPLLLACAAGAGRAAEVLLRARADPNRGDSYLQETPLLRAVLAGCSNELLWLLLEARADPSQADLAGRIPEQVASSWGNAPGAEILRAAAAGQLALSSMD